MSSRPYSPVSSIAPPVRPERPAPADSAQTRAAVAASPRCGFRAFYYNTRQTSTLVYAGASRRRCGAGGWACEGAHLCDRRGRRGAGQRLRGEQLVERHDAAECAKMKHSIHKASPGADVGHSWKQTWRQRCKSAAAPPGQSACATCASRHAYRWNCSAHSRPAPPFAQVCIGRIARNPMAISRSGCISRRPRGAIGGGGQGVGGWVGRRRRRRRGGGEGGGGGGVF
jgi:hypothetical protein